jgi:uncharacterized membrane protein
MTLYMSVSESNDAVSASVAFISEMICWLFAVVGPAALSLPHAASVNAAARSAVTRMLLMLNMVWSGWGIVGLHAAITIEPA